jgi:preprotein translocase subunit YajC
MEWLIPSAYAQAAGGAQPNAFMQLLPLVLIFVVFYFLLIRPQQKRQKEHQALMASLVEGDHVITIGGAYGTVRTIEDDDFGAFDAPGFPLRFSDFPEQLALRAPRRGEHNAEILREYLGLGDAEIAALEQEGILVTEATKARKVPARR